MGEIIKAAGGDLNDSISLFLSLTTVPLKKHTDFNFILYKFSFVYFYSLFLKCYLVSAMHGK